MSAVLLCAPVRHDLSRRNVTTLIVPVHSCVQKHGAKPLRPMGALLEPTLRKLEITVASCCPCACARNTQQARKHIHHAPRPACRDGCMPVLWQKPKFLVAFFLVVF
jgi:hypothetical protein